MFWLVDAGRRPCRSPAPSPPRRLPPPLSAAAVGSSVSAAGNEERESFDGLVLFSPPFFCLFLFRRRLGNKLVRRRSFDRLISRHAWVDVPQTKGGGGYYVVDNEQNKGQRRLTSAAPPSGWIRRCPWPSRATRSHPPPPIHHQYQRLTAAYL